MSHGPIQLIVAGKANPADTEGQEMIRDWVRFTRRPEVLGRAIFLSDYDMILTEKMVGGVDLWINTPRRPWEACGTSGMKVLANGGLNLSVLEGWWAEACSPEVGWAIGDGQEHGNEPDWDRTEAEELYTLLENEIIPQFYDRGKDGVPTRWVAMIRKSVAELTMRFSAHRAVKEYTNERYLELYAYVPGGPPFRQVMNPGDGTTKGNNVRVYTSQVPSTRPADDYTPRIIPSLPGLATPLELNLILWQP